MPPQSEALRRRPTIKSYEILQDSDVWNDSNVNFHLMIKREFLNFDAKQWMPSIGENNRVAAIMYENACDKKTRIVKVPRDSDRARLNGRAEIAILKLLTETDSPPFAIPRVERVEENPFYFVLTPVQGSVLKETNELSSEEKQSVGAQVAHIAMWEENIDVRKFETRIDQEFGKRWDWQTFFKKLDFSDTRFPSLSVAAAEMRGLRDRFSPGKKAPDQDMQVIHGDLRLSNIDFKGEKGRRVLNGIHDWGAARIGSRAEECRSLYPLGLEAIEAANNEFATNNRPPVDPEEVRLWYMGRFVVGLIYQLQEGILPPQEYSDAVKVIKEEFAEMDWSEIPTVEVLPAYSEAGVPFAPNFNGFPGLS